MANYNMEYSEERGTWNLFVDNEWYAEGDYEYIENMIETFRVCEAEEYENMNAGYESDYYGDMEDYEE